MSKSGWFAVDLDGTLAQYDTYKKEIGEPIPLMVERVKLWLEEGKIVKIFTARVAEPPRNEESISEIRKRIEDWCEQHLGRKLEITNVKDHGLIELWDDRAVGVKKNTGERVG